MIGEQPVQDVHVTVATEGTTAIEAPDTLIRVTASIGVAQYARQHDTLETLLRKADIAMYEAKKAGRNRVAGYPKTDPSPYREEVRSSDTALVAA